MKSGHEFWQCIGRYLAHMELKNQDLANALGILPSTLSTWKGRNQIPGLSHLDIMADFFHCSLDDLVADGERMAPNRDGLIEIPLISQKLSCGHGEHWECDIEVKSITIMDHLAGGQQRDSLVAAMVKGDSMEGASIHDGDVVIFSRGLVSGNGIYAIAIDGEVYVKRLAWNPVSREISIISENPIYPPMTIGAEDDRLIILGKVTGWLHTNR